MLQKTMIKLLNKKINDWIETITDESVKETIEKNLIVCGGCFSSMVQGENINDFDCYLRTKEAVLEVANYYIHIWNERETTRKKEWKAFVLDGENPSSEILSYFNVTDIENSSAMVLRNTHPERVKIILPSSDGIAGDQEEVNDSVNFNSAEEAVEEIDDVEADKILEDEKERYFPVFLSANAITLSDKIQIVVRFYGEPEYITKRFDFEHTKAYYDCGNKKLVIPNKVYELTTNKTLVYSGSKYPIASLFRLRKFISRGWTINAGQILKIAMQVSELDLLNMDLLEDQLVGVDSLYFLSMIRQFRKKELKDPEFNLTPNYVLSIIDKVFN